ncbi:MAG: hypothetical protein WC711_00490 [Candidatus Staskawiczbacteria bacterium]|jgi:hypothetical protein
MANTTRFHRWFIEPTGKDVAHANEVIAKNLPNVIDGFWQRCSDGKRHYLWECSFKEAQNFWNSRHTLKIDVCIWSQEGKGQIHPHTFLLQRERPAVTAIKRQVAKMKARRKACLQTPWGNGVH